MQDDTYEPRGLKRRLCTYLLDKAGDINEKEDSNFPRWEHHEVNMSSRLYEGIGCLLAIPAGALIKIIAQDTRELISSTYRNFRNKQPKK